MWKILPMFYYDNFPLARIFDKVIQIRAGQAPVQAYVDDLMQWVVQNRIGLDDIITHQMPLSEVSGCTDIFYKKKDNWVKAVLQP